MTLTATQKRNAGRLLARNMFPQGTVCGLDADDLEAAIDSLDTAMDMVIDDIPAAWGTKTVKQALIDNLPEPFKSNSTAQQKALALRLWAEQEAG